ncbi:MAG TPA: S8 family serine peptidase [Candidatus Poseidoniaceae archaeon]|nr:S8 family serine peptidase [Candidatus Poseidoniaceae archaeon]HII97546.1 S8 family serine peptidase [Candidatus Poseidoniaceae archaeon]
MTTKAATQRLIVLTVLSLLVLPLAMASVSVPAVESSVEEEGWWVETTVDRDGNGIGDMVERYHDHPLFLDEDGTLPLIIDFDHTPTPADVAMLEREVGYEHAWDLPLIDAVAGRLPHDMVLEATTLPGVVMLELDGLLEVQNGDAAVVHEVDLAQQATGYDGSGVTVAVIDTGIDGMHVGLDDMDDDNSTDDPKIIGFYDPVNNPDKVNGTEVFPYDDQGHGSHCAGTVAGTGAPSYDHPGMAPGAFLVGVKVLDAGGSGSFAVVMAGMQWTVDYRYEFNIRAASMSLGGPGAIEWTSSEEDSVNRMSNEMVRAGITMLIAAGNSAVSAQIGTPGSSEDAITVGALDKDTSIAIYSSQGPTEEGRIKPNLAFVGSDVMSVAHNTGDGYVAFSGTSMATPGTAGTVALMLQANPDLSPFDVRNILQETATYRECHYMLANEPCAEDLLPKNRQNNVYGHGHVEALAAVMEAAQRDYQLDDSISVVLETTIGDDNRIHLMPGDAIDFTIQGDVDSVQWRSNHLRDDWATLHGYEPGTEDVSLDLLTIVHQLEHLPGVSLDGNHTLSVRGLSANDSGGHSSSSNVAVNVMLMDTANAKNVESAATSNGISAGFVSALVVVLLGLALGAVLVVTRSGGDDDLKAPLWTEDDADVAAVVDSVIDET